MALPHEAQDFQDSSLFLDALLCEEATFEEDSASAHSNNTQAESHNYDSTSTLRNPSSWPLILLDNDLFWEDHELVSLISKEGQTHFTSINLIADALLQESRHQAVTWISKACSHHAFSALTAVLAVNYFDRFITSLRFQKDKPWMIQLTAVASLSLAAKVEETQVPLLLDLQVEESKYLFEAKTIQRMELLVLSTLQWRMNPVTPISFFQHIVRRLGLKTPLHWEFLFRCERVLLSVILDSRIMSYLPSILAVAIMIHVISEIEPFNAMKHRNQLMGILDISEEQVNNCYKLILKLLCGQEDIQNLNQKRRRPSEPSTPDGVIDAPFSRDSSNDSWTKASSVSFSLEPMFKRSRARDQHMHLPSISRVSIDVLHSPR
ncbi:Cyclin-D3-2 [Senna tora]|uniref:B-like cyclin n=1 Tax=Senna tora TaxID=362788 RepID=A0A834TWU1_9FABA|nr:Cyclin-D3-2 [Senna tora]